MTLLNQTYGNIDLVRQQSCGAILFCSLGKDSLVLLDLIYPKFDRIVCVFMYFVEGLEHIEKYVRWVKARYPKIEFIQVPHWNLSHILKGGTYCVPKPKTKALVLKDIIHAMRLKYGIKHVFLGMKKADSMNRRMMLNDIFNKSGNYENDGLCYPLADWTQKDILAYMKQNRLPEPVRYSKKASGGVGFNLDCFLWLRENYPQDLAEIIKVFPMSERILFEYDRTK